MKNWEIRKLGSDRSYLIFKSTDSGYDTIAKIEAVEPENMKLFFAAPEMLKVLEDTVEALKYYSGIDYSDLEEVIKKATGK